MKYKSPTSNVLKVMANVNIFRYVSQRSCSKLKKMIKFGMNKGNTKRNVYEKYENSTSNG